MEPALRPGDFIIVSRWYRRISAKEIVVFRHPRKNLILVKRVSGIGSDSVFVAGDNKTASQDSRSFGPVGRNAIIGKVIMRI